MSLVVRLLRTLPPLFHAAPVPGGCHQSHVVSLRDSSAPLRRLCASCCPIQHVYLTQVVSATSNWAGCGLPQRPRIRNSDHFTPLTPPSSNENPLRTSQPPAVNGPRNWLSSAPPMSDVGPTMSRSMHLEERATPVARVLRLPVE